MTLRNKAFLFCLTALCGVALAVHLLLSAEIEHGAAELDDGQVVAETQRVQEALSDQLRVFAAVLAERASSAEAGDVLRDVARVRVGAGAVHDATPERMRELRADLVLYLDEDGQAVLERLLDEARGGFATVPTAWIERLTEVADRRADGFLNLDGELWMIATRPIRARRTSAAPDSSAESAWGRLLWGRRLATESEPLANELGGIEVEVTPFGAASRSDRAAGAGADRARVLATPWGEVSLHVDDDGEPGRYAVVASVGGLDDRPAARIGFEVARSFRAQGFASRYALTLSIVVLILVLCIVHLCRLDRRTFAPIAALTARTAKIDGGLVADQLLEMPNRGEVGRLAQRIHDLASRFLAVEARAVQASRAKSEFLADMSHEIRTPMTAILGFADSDVGRGDRQEAVHTIHRNGSHLMSILDDIVGVSESGGELILVRGPCSPMAIVWDVLDMMRAKARTKNIELLTSSSPGVPETIFSDATRIRQVLLNLLGNALKFTDKGQISIGVLPIAEENAGGRPRLRFDVVDTGIGMTLEQQKTIFRAFEQAEISTARRFGGTGLGLSICQRLAALLGGGIQMTSTPGVGSRFSFEIDALPCEDAVPLASADGDRLPADALYDSRLAGIGVLIADEPGDNRRLIELVLRDAGATVDVAADGRHAYGTALRAWRAARPYDIVILDAMMPGPMSGCAAATALREIDYGGPILAVSASAMPEDRDRCLAARCDGFLVKPFRCAALVSAIVDCMREAEAAAERAAAAERLAAALERGERSDHDTGAAR